MRKWKAWLFALAVLIGIGTIGTASMKAEAQNLNQGKRVLFISSYSYGWDTVQTQIEGIKAGVDENTTIDYEFMDTKRFRTDEWLNMFHDMLKYHLENTDPYDVVMEVKFNGFLLGYIRELINSINRSELSVSKYVLARQNAYQTHI